MAFLFLVELVPGSFSVTCVCLMSAFAFCSLERRCGLCIVSELLVFCLELSLLPRSDLKKVEIYFFKESSSERICHRILSESAIELA